MSRSKIYSKIHKIHNLVHQKHLTGKKECDKLITKLEEIIKILEKE